MVNIAVLCSGSGTNLQAIVDAVKAKRLSVNIALVVSDNKSAFALVRAKGAGIETLFIDPKEFKGRESYDKEVVKHLKKRKVELVVLAGFMRIISPYFVNEYRNRIMNIHPAILPAFKGGHAIKDALEHGAKVTGATVHFIDERVDNGPIILQRTVDVREDDTEESLLERVHRVEHEIYPLAIKLFAEGKLKIEGRRVAII